MPTAAIYPTGYKCRSTIIRWPQATQLRMRFGRLQLARKIGCSPVPSVPADAQRRFKRCSVLLSSTALNRVLGSRTCWKNSPLGRTAASTNYCHCVRPLTPNATHVYMAPSVAYRLHPSWSGCRLLSPSHITWLVRLSMPNSCIER